VHGGGGVFSPWQRDPLIESSFNPKQNVIKTLMDCAHRAYVSPLWYSVLPTPSKISGHTILQKKLKSLWNIVL